MDYVEINTAADELKQAVVIERVYQHTASLLGTLGLGMGRDPNPSDAEKSSYQLDYQLTLVSFKLS